MPDDKPTSSSQPMSTGSEPAAPEVAVTTAAFGQPALPPPEVQLPDGRIEHPRVHYQTGDAPLAAVLIIMVAVIGYACAHYSAAWWFFRNRERSEQAAKQSTLPLSLQPVDSLPVEPRLEQLDRLAQAKTPEVRRRQVIDEALLNSYGPTDEEGFVHVPIDRAMEYLVGRLPVRKPRDEEAVRNQGLIDAGDSNSGRMFRGRP